MKTISLYGIVLGASLTIYANSVLAQQTINTPVVQEPAATPPPFVSGPRIAVELLPTPVQATLQKYAAGWPIASIQQGTINGQTVYEATLQRNGQMVPVQIARNGGLIRSAVNDRFFATVGSLPGPGTTATPATTTPARIPDWHTAPERTPLMDGTEVTLQSLPQAVQRSFLSYSGGSDLGSVQQGKLGDRVVYEAQVHPDGQKFVLRVDQNGILLNDQVNDHFLALRAGTIPGAPGVAVGRPATEQSGTLTVTGPGLAPLLNGNLVPLGSVPEPVRATLEAQANPTTIREVTRGTLDGRNLYEATIDRAGRPIRVRIAEDGSILGTQPAVAR